MVLSFALACIYRLLCFFTCINDAEKKKSLPDLIYIFFQLLSHEEYHSFIIDSYKF